jgi:hypothetical protein
MPDFVREQERFRAPLSKLIDIEHPWVKKYRVAAVSSFERSHLPYVANLIVPQEGEENLFKFLPVTEEDAALVSVFIEFQNRTLSGHYRKALALLPVDLDSGVNTISFGRRDHGWVYSKFTWNVPFFPYHDAEIQFATLSDVIEHAIGSGRYLDEWRVFKAERL